MQTQQQMSLHDALIELVAAHLDNLAERIAIYGPHAAHPTTMADWSQALRGHARQLRDLPPF